VCGVNASTTSFSFVSVAAKHDLLHALHSVVALLEMTLMTMMMMMRSRMQRLVDPVHRLVVCVDDRDRNVDVPWLHQSLRLLLQSCLVKGNVHRSPR